MKSSLLTAQNVIVQGITGAHGAFHAQAMKNSGTNIVAGTSPNKAGQFIDTIPVYNSIKDIQKDFAVDISVILYHQHLQNPPLSKQSQQKSHSSSVSLKVFQFMICCK